MKSCHNVLNDTLWYQNYITLPEDWDTGLPEDHFLLRETLRVHEKSQVPHVENCYALLRNQDGIIARASFQIISVQTDHVSRESLSAWQFAAWRTYIKLVKPKLLVGGQLFRHDVITAWFGDCMNAWDAFTWYRKTLKAAAKTCNVQAFLTKEPPPDLVPLFMHNAPDYLLLRNDSIMQMMLPEQWTSISDYEKSLKHKYAQRFRKVRQSWQQLEIRELDAVTLRKSSSELYRLYLQVSTNQSVRMGILSEAFIPDLKDYYGDRLRVWGMYEAGKIVAFASAWVHDDCFDMFYIGFDYGRNTELQLYFNILFFSIEQAILFRKSKLVLGRTALEAKARVGCRPVYLNTFLHIPNPVMNRVVSYLQQRLSEPGNEWEQRHPFKPATGL